MAFERAWEASWRRVVWPHNTAHRKGWKAILEEERGDWEAAYRWQPRPVRARVDTIELHLSMAVVDRLPALDGLRQSRVKARA